MLVEYGPENNSINYMKIVITAVIKPILCGQKKQIVISNCLLFFIKVFLLSFLFCNKCLKKIVKGRLFIFFLGFHISFLGKLEENGFGMFMIRILIRVNKYLLKLQGGAGELSHRLQPEPSILR